MTQKKNKLNLKKKNKLKKKHKSLNENFEWTQINPNLSILIGENGSGKTTLLTLIDKTLENDSLLEVKHFTRNSQV